MTVRSVDYLLLDGARYAAVLDRFRRSHALVQPSQLAGKRPEPPYLDAEINSFEGGIKGDRWNDDATWAADLVGLQGFSPTGSNLPFTALAAGRTLDTSHTASGAGPIIPLAADEGYLYAGEQGSDKVLKFDGATWTAVSTGSGSTAGVSALVAKGGYVVAAFADKDQAFVSHDHGATWSAMTAFSSTVGIPVLTLVYLTTDGTNAASLWLGVGDRGAGGVALLAAFAMNGSGVTSEPRLAESTALAACSTGSTAYICGAEVDEPISGHLYSWEYQGNLTPLAKIDNNYATAMCVYDGDVFLGCAARGELHRWDGSRLSLERVFSTTKPIRGLTVFGGHLWAAIYNDTDGRVELHRYTGQGWDQPHYVSESNDYAGGLAAFGGVLYVGGGSGTTRRVYVASATNRVTSAVLTTPDAVFGSATITKRFRRVAVQHSALLAGQAVALEYSLDGGAWTALLTNRQLGAAYTRGTLPDATAGGRLALRATGTNGATQDFAFYGAAVRALAAPEAREQWDATLILAPVSNGGAGLWLDGTADTTDSLTKWEQLAALVDGQQVFQAVDPFRDGSDLPRRAMLATWDQQVTLGADFSALKGDVQGTLQIRLQQAGEPENLIDNAGFERDGTAAAPPAGWGVLGTGTYAGTDNSTSVSPSYSARLTFDGASASCGLQQTVSGLVPGRYYTLSVYLHAGSLTDGQARADVYESGVLDYGDAAIDPVVPPVAAIWGRYTLTFLYPLTGSGTVAVRVYGEDTPAGTVYWDSLQLEPGAPASDFRERGQ